MRPAASTCRRDHDSGFDQARDRLPELRFLRRDVETALGGDLVPAFGDQHRHLGLDPARDADHFVGGGHLEVQPDVGQLAQAPHVLVLDVAPVLAQVHGDAVGAAQVRLDRRPDRVGLVSAARLAHRGDVVDVDAELDHRSFSSISTVRVCSTCPWRRSPMSVRSSARASSRVSGRA